MCIVCDGCGRLIAEGGEGHVRVKHRGRVMRIVEGELVCECGTVTAIRAGMPVTEEGKTGVTVEIAALLG